VTLDQDILILQGVPLFADFPVEQLRLIAFSAEPLKLPPGTTLFREGAPADRGFVVVRGAVKLTTQGDDGPRELAVVGPGSLIGELALLCATTRPATATTSDHTELLAVSRRLLRRMLEEYPEMAGRMRAALSQRLARLTSELGGARERLLAMDGEVAE
jgi:CRP-like cAMP-binding protein